MDNLFMFDAFKALDSLNEDTFKVDDEGIEELSEFEKMDKIEDSVDIIDIHTDDEEELEDSYIGKVILACNVCDSKVFEDKDKVVIDEETPDSANTDMECPYCHTVDGFKIIGEIGEFHKHADDDDKDEDEEEEIEDKEEEEIEVEDEEESENLEESKHKKFTDEDDIDADMDDEKEAAKKRWERRKNDARSKRDYRIKHDLEEDFKERPDIHVENNQELWETYFNGTDYSVDRICELLGISRGELTYAYIPNSVTEIGKYAFSNCTSLKSITIPDSVTSIGEHAFFDCHSLESVTIPNSVRKIGAAAFYYCKSLKSVTIPDSITELDEYVFADCHSLHSITIPSSIIKIDAGAFYYCKSLKSITIPSSVTEIDDYAFSYCDSLTDVHYEGTKEQWAYIDIGYSNNHLEFATIHYNKVADSENLEEDFKEHYYIDVEGLFDDDGAIISETELRKIWDEGITGKDPLLKMYHDEDDMEFEDWVEVSLDNGYLRVAEREDLEEDFKEASITTDTEKMEMFSDENGKVTITTEPINSIEEEVVEDEEEVIAPISDETKAEIESDSEAEEPEEEEVSEEDAEAEETKEESEDEIDVDFDDIDEESFDELAESYLKTIYSNVESYKTTNASATKDKFMLEGLITFASGAVKNTNFVFAPKAATKAGKLQFIGENLQITKNRNAFKFNASIANKKLLGESLTYNYSTKDSAGKMRKLYGTIKRK